MKLAISAFTLLYTCIFTQTAHGAPSEDERKRLALQHQIDSNAPLMSASWVGTHNSYNNSDKGYVIPNHKVNMIEQLRAGFRVLNYDLHYAYGEVRLCHSSFGSQFCGAGDTPLQNALGHLKEWLKNNPNEVVLIGIEDYLKDNAFIKPHNIAAQKFSNRLADYIYAPKRYSPAEEGKCLDLPIRQLTKQDVLNAGKQVIFASFSGCKGTDRFEKWVWNMPIAAYKGNEGPKAADLNNSNKLSSAYEDRTFGSGPVDTLSDSQVRASLEKGANIIALDFGVKTNRHPGAIWSWSTNEPSGNAGEDCAKVNANGWWDDANCSNRYVFACQNKANGNWVTTTTSGTWVQGDDACRALAGDYIFAAPVNAEENKALSTITNGNTWVNASDLIREGYWEAYNFVHEALENGRHSEFSLQRFTKAAEPKNDTAVWYNFRTALNEPPSVFLSAPSFRDGAPGLLLFTDINKERAKVKFVEWDYQNNKHDKEDFDLLAMRNGLYRMTDGSIWEVGQFKIDGVDQYRDVLFENNFATTPFVFLTIQGPKRNDRVVVKARNVDLEGFAAALYEQEKSDGSHGTVTVSYLAIEPPESRTSGSITNSSGRFSYQLTSTTLDHNWKRIGQYQYALQEEQSRDSETNHARETINHLHINGAEFIQAVSNNGVDAFSIRRK